MMDNEILERILLELQKHTHILDKHTNILDRHTEILDKHSVILDKHSEIFTVHTREIQSIHKSVDNLETKLTKRIESIERKIG